MSECLKPFLCTCSLEMNALEGFCRSRVWGISLKSLFFFRAASCGKGLFTEPGCQSAWKGDSSVLAHPK